MSAWGKRWQKSGQEQKHGNERSTCARGHSHRSKLERAVCDLILLREKAGEIRLVQVEDHIYLTKARIGYVVDFKCELIDTGAPLWIEAKGFPNDRWPMKKKLWKHYGPGMLEIWRGTHARPYLDETIIPDNEEAA
jgi:hypothetical protein